MFLFSYGNSIEIIQVILLSNGYKDLFVKEFKSEYIKTTPIQIYQAARS